MKITIKNEITGLFNSIEFRLFEEFTNQNEYMGYLINAMNRNMDFILYIKSKTQKHFAQEHLKMFLFENGFLENEIKKIAQIEYCEMMSNVCIDTCMVHYRKTLKPSLIRRKKLADEYEKNFLGNLNEKKT